MTNLSGESFDGKTPHAKASDNWETPKWLMTIFDTWEDLVPINYQYDCLRIDWYGKSYVNPPYSNPLPFVLKAIEQYRKGVKPIVLLLKLDTSTRWYKELDNAGAHFLYFAERLHYSESKGSPNFPSLLAILSD